MNSHILHILLTMTMTGYLITSYYRQLVKLTENSHIYFIKELVKVVSLGRWTLYQGGHFSNFRRMYFSLQSDNIKIFCILINVLSRK